EILFKGMTTHWEGKSPSGIEGEENPTIALTEGETYTIGWDEGDGQPHNFQIRNGSDEVVGDYTTDTTPDPGEAQVYEIEVTSEMAAYRCMPHPNMEGTIEVQ
ncbi:blue copper domain-containing protein, partial [Halovivax asiaticus JCM 14624]